MMAIPTRGATAPRPPKVSSHRRSLNSIVMQLKRLIEVCEPWVFRFFFLLDAKHASLAGLPKSLHPLRLT